MAGEYKPKHFAQIDQVDISAMYDTVNHMILTLFLYDAGQLGKSLCSQSFNDYIESLVDAPRPSPPHFPKGGYAVRSAHPIPKDFFFDVVMLPTYVAAATFSKIYLSDEFSNDPIKEKIEEVICATLKFCCLTDLGGHSYDRHQETLWSAEVLAVGNVPYLLQTEKLGILPLKNVMHRVAEAYLKDIETGNTLAGWGNTPHDDTFNRIVSLLTSTIPMSESIGLLRGISPPFQGKHQSTFCQLFESLKA